MGRSGRALGCLPIVLAALAACSEPTSAGPTLEAPTALTATELSSGDIEVSWLDNSDSETAFQLDRSTTGPTGAYATIASLAPDVTSYEDSQVDGVSQYCYRVRAVGAAGTTPSAFASPACLQFTAPPAPSQLVATASFGQVGLSWSDNSGTEAGFEVWTSTSGANGTFSLEASVAANATSYQSLGRQDGIEYCYRVRAVSAGHLASAFSNTTCATTPVPTDPPPGAPTGLAAAVSASTTVSLAWSDNASDELGFEIWRSTSGATGVYAPIDTVGANVAAAADTALTAGTQYCYRVRALGGGTAPPSSFSNSSCATVPAPPAAPSNLAASPTSSTAISLTWTDNSADEQGFEIWRSTTGPSGTYTLLATVGAGVTTTDDAGLTSGNQYCYTVRATGTGFAPPSAFSASACATPPAPPDAPSGLTATAASATTVTLAWTDNSSDEAGFEIRRASTANGTYTIVDTVAADATGATDTALSSSTQYCYRVRALGAGVAQSSSLSNSDCATTPPKTPSAVQAAPTTPTRMRVTWQDNSNDEAGFEVWRSTTGTNGNYSLRGTVAANSVAFTDTGLASATEYCYEVRATGAGSAPDSPRAGPACATTPLYVRVVLFGDSNTDYCPDHQGGSDPLRFHSYVSVKPALAPAAQHLSCSVAGKVVAGWSGLRSESLLVVNHGIASTTTGGLGVTGDPERTNQSAPNARALVNGIRRYEAEVLGLGAPNWNGGETNTTAFPNGPVTRVSAYVPKTNDFAYVSMGTNDDAGATRTLTASQTTDNLRWMITNWTAAGHQADHFILTTLAPRTDGSMNTATGIPDRNDLIRALATELGVHLIDLAAQVSDDNGLTWRSDTLNIGDGVHYTEAVRSWLGSQIADWMSTQTPALP